MKSRMNRFLKSKIVLEFGTAEDFAEHINIHPSLVSRVIRGRRELSDDEKNLWAKELQCAVDMLFPTK